MFLNRGYQRFSFVPILIGTVAIVGCTEQPQFTEEELQTYVLETMNSEKEFLLKFSDTMKNNDPTVKDAYYGINDSGDKTLYVTKMLNDGSVAEVPLDSKIESDIKSSLQKQSENQTDQSATAGSSSDGMDMLTGAVLGYMAAQMLAGNNVNRYVNQGAYEERKRTVGSAYVASSMATARATYRPTSSVGKSPSALGRSTTGSFGSSGARSSGYSAGG